MALQHWPSLEVLRLLVHHVWRATLASLDSVCCAASQRHCPSRQHARPRKPNALPASPPASRLPTSSRVPRCLHKIQKAHFPISRRHHKDQTAQSALFRAQPPRRSSVSVPASAAAFRQSCSSTVPLDLGSSLYTDQPSFTTINRSAVGADAGAMCGIDWPLCNCVA